MIILGGVIILGGLLAAADYYGLGEEYNYFTAKRDIRKGKVQILVMGFVVPRYEGEKGKKAAAAQKIIERRFGYTTVYPGCTVRRGSLIYNSVVRAYLDKRNGPYWEDRVDRMFDSLMAASH